MKLRQQNFETPEISQHQHSSTGLAMQNSDLLIGHSWEKLGDRSILAIRDISNTREFCPLGASFGEMLTQGGKCTLLEICLVS